MAETGSSTGRWPVHARIAVAVVLLLAAPADAVSQDVRGAWRAETYSLATGEEYVVEGQIIFTASDWTVLFFVMAADGAPQRGSAEGGTYTLEEGRLVFTHLFHFSVGDALPGLAASELRMVARRDASEAPVEPARVERVDDRLTIHFPSGNRMTFRLSSSSE